MKMGEIGFDPAFGPSGFIMQTTTGVKPVTLRCTHSGEVHVEEVSGGGMTVRPLKITQIEGPSQIKVIQELNRVPRRVPQPNKEKN